MSPRKPKTDQKRVPKKRRTKKPPHFQITARDILFIKAVLKYKFLMVDQFTWVFPDASKRGMENRLRLLYHNRYLDRILLTEVHSNKLIYAMTEKGAHGSHYATIPPEDGFSFADLLCAYACHLRSSG